MSGCVGAALTESDRADARRTVYTAEQPRTAQRSGGSVGLTILVSSRERLHIAGEHVFNVPAVEEADAAAPLIDRAAAVNSDAAANRDVAAICRRLDNLSRNG